SSELPGVGAPAAAPNEPPAGASTPAPSTTTTAPGASSPRPPADGSPPPIATATSEPSTDNEPPEPPGVPATTPGIDEPCPGGATPCAEACVDLRTDTSHCGICGNVCVEGGACTDGQCVPPSSQPEPSNDGAPTSIADEYPCDGDPSGYDAGVRSEGGGWSVQRAGNTVHQGNDLVAAVKAAFDSLDSGRSGQQSVLLLGDGTIDAQTRISIPSYTLFNVCGTIDVEGSPSGDNAPAYSRGTTDITIPNFSATGVPAYGMFFRNVNNLHLGTIDLRLTSGLGIRVDNHGDRAVRSTNLRIDDVYVQGA